MKLHRTLSSDLANQDSPCKSIPLGYDEGFLSYMPSSARVDPQRLKRVLEIQHQIQEGMALSPAEPVSLTLTSSGASSSVSPCPSVKEPSKDVEQDDTITSSTSLDAATSVVALRHRTASSDTAVSPVPSPENSSEPDLTGAEDLGMHSESSLLMVPKESHARPRSLFMPPPNIPEYKPTPLYEPSPKRYKVGEDSRHSSSIPVERGSPASGSSTSSGLSFRTPPLKVPSIGLTHVRSPRDLPLPISPADSSTDKVKSYPPASSNITTANDMKNFLNASLEKKPSTRPPPPLSRR